jgi:hypothetical protein
MICKYQGCDKLQSIVLPESLTKIRYAAFAQCKSLSSINIPDAVTFIDIDAFYDTALYNNSPNGVIYIGKWAVGSKSDNTEEGGEREFIVKDGTVGVVKVPDVEVISIPSSVKYFSYKAERLNSLKRIYVDGENNLDAFDFTKSSELTTTILGNEVKSIKENQFWAKKNLKTVIMGYGLRSIGGYAFESCTSLEKVRIPNGVETVGNNAFANCDGLTTVTIPNSVTDIGYRAFYNDLALVSENSHIAIPKKLNESVFSCGDGYDSHTIYYIATLYVPRGRTTLYKNVEGWKLFASIEEKDVAYELTYILDGDVYKSMEIQPGITITPEPDPVKDGYVFAGWRTVPATMPDHDVVVYGEFVPYTNGINEVCQESVHNKIREGWFTLNGIRLPKEPQTTGIYVHNGKKVVIK